MCFYYQKQNFDYHGYITWINKDKICKEGCIMYIQGQLGCCNLYIINNLLSIRITNLLKGESWLSNS